MRATLLLTAAIVLGAAGCSSDSKSTTTSAAAATTAAAPTSTAQATATTAATTAAPATTAAVDTPTSTVAAPTLTADQQQVVQLIIDNSKNTGFALNEACIGALVAQLDDADIATLLSAGQDPEAAPPLDRLTPAAQAVFTSGIAACIGTGNADPQLAAQAADVAIQVTTASSTTKLDRACVVDAFGRLTNDQLQLIIDTNLDTTNAQLQPVPALLLSCVQS